MKLNTREIVLAWLTGVVVLFVGTYALCEPIWNDMQRVRADMEELQSDVDTERRLVQLGPRWDEKLDGILAGLPRHAPTFDVTASLLREIEAQASAQGYRLSERRADSEEVHSDYSELDISCLGSSSLNGIVGFLYDLRSKTAMMEVKQLRIEKDKFDYRVRVTINCVYGRDGQAPSTGGPQT